MPRSIYLISGAALLLVSALSAAETRQVDDFSEISFSLPFDVEFVRSDDTYVTLEGDEDTIEDIVVEVERDTLKLYKEDSWFDWKDSGEVLITIGYEDLESITMAGSGDGFAERLDAEELTLRITGSANLEVDEVEADEIDLSIAGSGNIELHDVDTDSITAKIAGSGDVDLTGRAVTQEISISGSGDHTAGELRTQETTASVRGSGDIVVWAQARLSASVVGSGDIGYYGNPETSERIVGSGDRTHLGDEP